MTILKSTVLTGVNDRLGLVLTDIDAKLLAVMKEIASLTPGMLQKSGDVTVLINTTNIASGVCSRRRDLWL